MDTPAPRTVTTFITLEGNTSGQVAVADGGTLVVSGTHEGPVVLEGGASLLVTGALHGTVEIASLASATVSGDLVGQVDVRIAGTLLVEADGRLAGPVTNYGSFTNRGIRSGPVEGRPPLDENGALEVAPLHPGVYNYSLPARD
jgi:hypothetical protein